MKKRKTIQIHFTLQNLTIFLYCFFKINTQSNNTEYQPKYEIHIKFGGTGLKTIYCDDNIEFYHTENINFYKIDINGLKENISTLLIKRFN